MITKVQSKELRREAILAPRPKLSPVERGMLRWVVLDPGDRVLDANTRDGLMLEYLYRNMECEICGLSTNMEQVKESRSRLQNADVMYASAQDIPWREESFDAVMLRKERGGNDRLCRILEEVLRVLKPGGQFLLGTTYYPTPIRQLAGIFAQEEEEQMPAWMQSKKNTLHLMRGAGFRQVSWQQGDLLSAVAIGWKPGLSALEPLPAPQG